MAKKPSAQLSLGLFEWDTPGETTKSPVEELKIDPPVAVVNHAQTLPLNLGAGSPGQDPVEIAPPVQLIYAPPACLHYSGTKRLNVGPEISDDYPPAGYRPVSRDDLFLVPDGLNTEQERELIQQRRVKASDLVAIFRKDGRDALADQYLKDLGAYSWRLWELDHPVKECAA